MKVGRADRLKQINRCRIAFQRGGTTSSTLYPGQNAESGMAPTNRHRRARIDAEAAVTVARQRFVQYARQLGVAAARDVGSADGTGVCVCNDSRARVRPRLGRHAIRRMSPLHPGPESMARVPMRSPAEPKTAPVPDCRPATPLGRAPCDALPSVRSRVPRGTQVSERGDGGRASSRRRLGRRGPWRRSRARAQQRR